MTKIKSIRIFVILFIIILGATSCDDNLVYEKEGDCSPKVQFVLKKHRQALHQIPGRETDVFFSTVGSVHLFVYNVETQELVFEKIEETDNLLSASDLKIGNSTDRCYMDVDINPGRYRIVAWCGLGSGDSNNAFQLSDGTRSGYSHCEVKRDRNGHPYKDAQYEGLYHGIVRDVEVSINGKPQIIPIELTKNSNDIHVWVQHSNEIFQPGDYEVVYTDANGTMHFEDNSMTDNSKLEYRAHTSTLLTTDTEYNGNLVESGALISHLSTSRLMKSHVDDARLEVRDRRGNTVFSVPFIRYVLEMQTFVDDHSTKADGRDYQYYLDCEDTYNCTFYLTGDKEHNGLWTPAMIIINNWVKVPDQNEVM